MKKTIEHAHVSTMLYYTSSDSKPVAFAPSAYFDLDAPWNLFVRSMNGLMMPACALLAGSGLVDNRELKDTTSERAGNETALISGVQSEEQTQSGGCHPVSIIMAIGDSAPISS